MNQVSAGHDSESPDQPAATGAVAGAPPPQESTLRQYLRARPDPLTGLILTLPVFLLYHLGLLAIDVKSGVDLISGAFLRLLESPWAYAGVTIALAVLLPGVSWGLRRAGKLAATSTPKSQAPWLIGESTVWAATLWLALGWTTGQLFQTGAAHKLIQLNAFEKLVLSAGAGFHEELVFRVILFSGGAWLLLRVVRTDHRVKRWGLWAAAAIGSSWLFAVSHYLGDLGDVLTLQSFFFRTLAGVALCVIYRFRGFPVAVWTHFLYDVAVFFF